MQLYKLLDFKYNVINSRKKCQPCQRLLEMDLAGDCDLGLSFTQVAEDLKGNACTATTASYNWAFENLELGKLKIELRNDGSLGLCDPRILTFKA